MNRLLVAFFILIICGSFTPLLLMTSIYGTIEPAEGASKVWAVQAKDSVSVIPEAGKFSIKVPSAGNWKLMIETIKPFKPVTIDNINVIEGRSTDAGVIRLSAE